MQQDSYELAVELRHALHAHPELSGQETATIERLCDFIQRYTSFVPVIEGGWFWVKIPAAKGLDNPEKPQPLKVAFRADMDALPIPESLDVPYVSRKLGVSHKCGHDGHCASLAGLALELEKNPPPVETYLIFQAAEETGGGGAAGSQLLIREKIDWVFAFHNWSGIPQSCVALKSGVAQMASLGLSVGMTGVTAHASQPEDGKNPAAALAELLLYVLNLAGLEASGDSFSGQVLATVINVAIGEKNFGISASTGEVSFTLRAEYESDLAQLKKNILDQARELSRREGLDFNYREFDVFPETRNHEIALKRVRQAAEHGGFSIVDLERPWRASEDFGHYLKLVPGAMVYIGNGLDYPSIHTADYDFVDANLRVVVDLWLNLLADFATDV